MTAFFDHGKNVSKNTFAFLCLSFTYSLLCPVSFSCIQLEGDNKTGKTKTTAFFDHGKNVSKNTFAFLQLSVSFIQSYVLLLMLPTQKQKRNY